MAGSALKGAALTSLLDALVRFVPSPASAEEIPARNGSGEDITLTPSANDNLAALVWKTIVDPYVGRLSLFRVYSGTVSPTPASSTCPKA